MIFSLFEFIFLQVTLILYFSFDPCSFLAFLNPLEIYFLCSLKISIHLHDLNSCHPSIFMNSSTYF